MRRICRGRMASTSASSSKVSGAPATSSTRSCPRGRIGVPRCSIPIEHAVLLIGVYELRHRQDVPYRVAINEAVTLAKRFGATDGHKYVNAVLDRAARALRPNEH